MNIYIYLVRNVQIFQKSILTISCLEGTLIFKTDTNESRNTVKYTIKNYL